MKVNDLGELVLYIRDTLIKDDRDRIVNMIFDEKEILLFVFENSIPIRIKRHKVYSEDFTEQYYKIFAEVDNELLTCNIGQGWLIELDEICKFIDENDEIFDKILKGENEND